MSQIHEEEAKEEEVTPVQMSREVANLRSYNNPGKLELEGQALYCFQVTEEEREPTNFEEAWNNEDIDKRQKW